ncbi:efflux RND transporter periplasmic adaptor subunit [Polystyrenella longa]|nr:HlyD family efflux transporter periplasmic adaptor subunit [Polystyrenella longa]
MLSLAIGSLTGFPTVHSQERQPAIELPPNSEITSLEKEYLFSNQDDEIADIAPNSPGYMIAKRCWVENLTQNRAILAFERPGVIDYIEPREGDEIEAGTIVGHLKDDLAQAQHAINVMEATNTVDKRYAEKAFLVAREKHKSAVGVNERIKGTIPDTEIRELKLDSERSELQIEQADHKKTVAELTAAESAVQLETYDLEAPFTGTVIKVYKSQGEAVGQGDPVIEILNIDTVRVNGWITRDRAQKIRRGNKVLVKLLLDNSEEKFPGSDKTLEGKIQFVDMKTVGVRGYVQVYADVFNEDRLLLPGSAVAMKVLE